MSLQEVLQTENRLLIAPSILSADFTRLGEEIASVEMAGADIIHLDIMDGHFVPNISFGPPVVERIMESVSIPTVAHLMIDDPLEYARRFAEIGVDGISFHLEAVADWRMVAERLRSFGVSVGLAVRPDTPLPDMDDIFGELDFVLVMSVMPGFSGQEFIPDVLTKVRAITAERDSRGIWLPVEMDGGINVETAKLCAEAGANVLVAASAVFKSNDYEEAIELLRG